MSRQRARHNKTNPSLFPFLAVLLSTMGVLVVLLVAMASVQVDQAKAKKKAKTEAAAIADAEAAAIANSPEQKQLQKSLKLAEEQRAKIEEQRELAKEDLRREQLRLGQIEENVRRWQDRLDSARREIYELQQLDSEHVDNLKEGRERLANLKSLNVEAKERIEDLEAEQGKGDQVYAIMPFDGPNGTRRRPIFIECLKDRVVIQPEGIELLPGDFNFAPSAANPLASSLRAIREYYASKNSNSLERDKEAYPLVVVRPEGIGSFGAVTGVLSAWNSPFGYEMVDADWKLDFGVANPELALEVATAIDNAREKLAVMAKNAPVAYRQGAVSSFSTGVGILQKVQSGAPLGGGYVATTGRRNAGAYGNSVDSLSIEQGRLAAAFQKGASSQREGSQSGQGENPRDQFSGSFAGSQGSLATAMANQGEASEHTAHANGSPTERYAATSGAPSETQPNASQNQVAASNNQAGSVATNAQGDSSSAAGSASAKTEANSRAANTQSASGSGSASASASNLSTNGASGSGRPQKSSQFGLAVQRPVQVVIRPDRLTVLHEGERANLAARRDSGRSVPLAGDTIKAAQQFTVALKQHIAEWGIAGQGSYWKPYLVLNVAPGGEKLASELSAALRESGIEVRLPQTARRK